MIDISRLSPAELDRFLYLQGMEYRQGVKHDVVIALRNYYYGDHPILLTDRQKEFLGPIVDAKEFTFSHNLVRSVVDTLRERLSVNGFTVNGHGAEDAPKIDEGGEPTEQSAESALAALFWEWWDLNRMDSQQIRCHRRALRDGTTYAIVTYDNVNQRPRINLHKVDDGDTGITFHRDPTDESRVMYAMRYFPTYDPLKPGATGLKRRTVYMPDQVRKYIMSGSGVWEQYSDPEDVDQNGRVVWPLPWVDELGQPLGIPVIEFANPGGSEISQIIGLQNALNKSWLDLIAAADAAGFPIVALEYEMGEDPPIISNNEEENKKNPLRLSPGHFLILEGGHAHRLETPDLSPLLEIIDGITTAIAGVTRTPQYYLRPINGNDVPSGESLKQLESGLTKRAQERQLMFGQSWADVMQMCYKVARAFGVDNLPVVDKLRIATQWGDAEVRNELTQAQTAQIYKALGMPDDYVWRMAGVQPDDIVAFMENARTERSKQLATMMQTIRQSRTTPTETPNGSSVNGRPSTNGVPPNVNQVEG